MMISGVCQEAKEKLVGGRVRQVKQVGKCEIALKVIGAHGKQWLFISAHPKFAHMSIRSDIAALGGERCTSFVSALQRHVEGAKVDSIEQIDFDRLVSIEFTARSEIGDPIKLRMMVELMGKHSNIILVDGRWRIIDALKRLPASVNRYREVLPGKIYIRPPTHGRINPLVATRSQVEEALRNCERSISLREWIQKTFHGMSEVLVLELLCRAGLNPDGMAESVGEHHLNALENAIAWLRQLVLGGQFNPVCLRSDSGVLAGCYPVELEHLKAEGSSKCIVQYPCVSLSECIAGWFEGAFLREEIEQVRRSICGELEGYHRRISEKISSLRTQLAEAQSADRWRIKGELLLTYAHKIEPGITEVTLDGYDGEKVEVRLDPNLSLSENAQRIFAKYKRLKGMQERLPSVIAKLEALVGRVKELIARVKCAGDLAELKQIRESAIKLGLLRDVGGVCEDVRERKFLKFVVADGFELLIGRSARENIELLTRVANPDDIWMHVRARRGAHGILRRQSRSVNFTESAIEGAARIVARRSGCEGKVAVDYTLAKYVRPVKGEQGRVTYTNHKTIVVDVDIA